MFTGPFKSLFVSITDLFNLYLTTKGNIAFKSPNLNAERSRTPIESIRPWKNERSNSDALRTIWSQKRLVGVVIRLKCCPKICVKNPHKDSAFCF